METTAQVNAVVATIVAQVPAHATIPSQVIFGYVFKLLGDLDTEVVAAATAVSQLAENNAVVAKVKKTH
jgi:hypothetical protein